MTIPDHVLKAIRDSRVIILEDGSLYDFQNAPLYVFDLIDEWKLEILQLIADSDSRLCADVDLHREHFKYIGNDRYICEKCWQIRESMKEEHS